jgi:hypothetical protein
MRRREFIFTPTSASWINQVERWFAELTTDIRSFIDRHNQKTLWLLARAFLLVGRR